MNASPSSLELAARLVPQRASRSASRVTAEATTTTELVTTTTAASPTTLVVVKRAAATTASTHTTKTTVKRKPTTTTARKPKSTTTTAKPAPKEPPPPRPFTPPSAGESTGQSETGQATWYDSPDSTMCAHKTIPMGTVVTVTDVDNGKTTTCKVGDRGPYVDGRIIDLSPEAFAQLAPLSDGVINVKLTW